MLSDRPVCEHDGSLICWVHWEKEKKRRNRLLELPKFFHFVGLVKDPVI